MNFFYFYLFMMHYNRLKFEILYINANFCKLLASKEPKVRRLPGTATKRNITMKQRNLCTSSVHTDNTKMHFYTNDYNKHFWFLFYLKEWSTTFILIQIYEIRRSSTDTTQFSQHSIFSKVHRKQHGSATLTAFCSFLPIF